MRAHLFRVEDEVEVFSALIAVATAANERVGWLEWRAPTGGDPALEVAVRKGCLRAAAVGEGRSQVLKGMKGEPVLEDVVREHFKGCRLVLVRGFEALPRLRSRNGGWEVSWADGRCRRWGTEELVTRLRRPRID